MVTRTRMKEIKAKHRDALFKKANVVGVGIGRKIVAGKITDEFCIKVYVEKKMSKSRLKERDIVPDVIEGVKTDVVEVGKIRFLGRRDRNRPARGGDSIGSCHSLAYGYIMAGTLGVALIDKEDGSRVLLSNNHVLANMDSDTESRASAGDSVVQPGTRDGGSCATDLIGTLKRWIPFTTSGDNEVDAAIASLTDEDDALECRVGCSFVIRCLPGRPMFRPYTRFRRYTRVGPWPFLFLPGRVRGTRELTEGDENVLQVQKCGRTTGHTTGTVLDIDADVNVGYEVLTPTGIVERVYTFTEQIMTTAMADIGDSGSLTLDMNYRAIGLLFAGSSTATYHNKIERVLDLLNVELCPPPDIHCLPNRPDQLEIACIVGGPDSEIEVAPLCLPGRPDQEVEIRCRPGRPDQVGPLCLACGPDSDIGCGTGGPDFLVRVYGCAAGPELRIHRIDPTIDPGRLMVLDMDKIPRGMQKSLKNMLKKMAKER